jgi:hypothetical protein
MHLSNFGGGRISGETKLTGIELDSATSLAARSVTI